MKRLLHFGRKKIFPCTVITICAVCCSMQKITVSESLEAHSFATEALHSTSTLAVHEDGTDLLEVTTASDDRTATPHLNFSDLDSEPNTGNTDGVGSWAIVTVWENNLGESQKDSKIFVGEEEATAVYYWKNAYRQLSGGPANLYQYHKMQYVCGFANNRRTGRPR